MKSVVKAILRRKRTAPRPQGIPADLYRRLEEALLVCGPTCSQAQTRALFVDKRLHPWYNHVPNADNPADRTRALIDALYDRQATQGRSALELLLYVLQEGTDPGDACYGQLGSLIEELQRNVA
ncbi:MAG: hypothetical protein JXA21_23180 [Anaerolineae bacterium]|nr:hypothetical protein [Anaerolineae bacterium]